MRPELRTLFWILAAVFALHEAEEWNLVSWFRDHFTPEPGFTDLGARTLLVLFASLAVSYTFLSIRFSSERSAIFALLPLYLAIVLGNAFTHVAWSLSLGSYAPGALSSLLLIPLALHLARVVLRERLAPRAYVFSLLCISLLLPLGALRTGTILSPQQVSIQALGERFARWLWGAA